MGTTCQRRAGWAGQRQAVSDDRCYQVVAANGGGQPGGRQFAVHDHAADPRPRLSSVTTSSRHPNAAGWPVAVAYACRTVRASNCCPGWVGWLSQTDGLLELGLSSPALQVLFPAKGVAAAVR